MVRHNPRLVGFDGFLSWLCQIPSPLPDLHRCCVCVTALWEILLHTLCRSLEERPQGCCSFIPAESSLAEAGFGILIYLPLKLQLKGAVKSGQFQNFGVDSREVLLQSFIIQHSSEEEHHEKGILSASPLFHSDNSSHNLRVVLRKCWDQDLAPFQQHCVRNNSCCFQHLFQGAWEVLCVPSVIFSWACPC